VSGMLTGIGDEKTIDRKVYLNTKLSVQVIAPKMQERRLIQAMSFIDGILQGGGSQRAKL
jgi:amidase